MTTIERIDHWDSFAVTWIVNGCLKASITYREATEATSKEWPMLVESRIAPLIWLAMPGHEDNA